MANYRAERINKKHFAIVPKRQGRTKREPFVIGFDSEAERGKPFLFQFSLPGGSRDDVELIDISESKDAGLIAFVDFLYHTCQSRQYDYIVWGFNLGYEYTQWFRDMPDDLKNAAKIHCEIYLSKYDDTITLKGMNDKRYTLTATLGRSKIRVKIVDAMAYFVMSLDAASKVIEVGAKLPKPKQFAKKYRHTPEFIAYAKQDAWLTRLLGEYIIALHERYDVATCMSAPHFACSTFRRHYLQTEIEPIDSDYEQYGLDSYHGGHNGYYLSDPAIVKDVWQYDIRSAYPEAMRQLPNIEEATTEFLDSYESGTHGIWEIVYRYSGCIYKPLLDREGKPLTKGEFTTRLTSYEIDAALELGEIELISAKGFVMRGPVGSGPLIEYVDTFYAMKQQAPTKAERTTAKLFLNSLYGKFFQKVPRGIVGMYELGPEDAEPVYIETDPDSDYDYDAGGLYHPPIASLITGYVRAKIHRLEHKYDALMTSTDGFFARNPPDPADLGDDLGKLDAQRGELRIWRERLYVFTARSGERKYALHGFRGKVADLLRLPVARGIYTYMADSMISLKMSTRRFRGQRYEAGAFVGFAFVLDLTKPP